jgi:integrase
MNLHAFLKWTVKNRFVASGLEIKKVKVPQKPVVALSVEQVRDLLTAALRYPSLCLRVLLAVTTGNRTIARGGLAVTTRPSLYLICRSCRQPLLGPCWA